MLPYDPLLDFVLRFLINLVILTIIARLVYYPRYRKREYAFTFIIIGSTIFVLAFMLSSINMELGLALGLFAVFGIIRYRTINIVVTEMTYLFFSITISVVNSLASAGYSNLHLIVANGAILIIILLMEFLWMRRAAGTMTIRYEKIQLVRPDRIGDLKADLESRLGIDIIGVSVGEIDFLRDTASVKVMYDPRKYPSFSTDIRF